MAMSLTTIIAFFLLLQPAAEAQVCGNPSLAAQCPSFSSFNCTIEEQSLSYNASSSSSFCNQPATGQVASPYPTLDAMYSSCEEFCGAGLSPLPVVIGSSGFGLGLEAAATVCLDPALLGKPFDRNAHAKCQEGSDAIALISDAAVGFTAEMRAFSYAVLEYRANVLRHTALIKERLMAQSTITAIARARRSEKASVIRALYSELLSEQPGTTILQSAIAQLKVSSRNLNAVIDMQLAKFLTFSDR
jgi:hypothetical protein